MTLILAVEGKQMWFGSDTRQIKNPPVLFQNWMSSDREEVNDEVRKVFPIKDKDAALSFAGNVTHNGFSIANEFYMITQVRSLIVKDSSPELGKNILDHLNELANIPQGIANLKENIVEVLEQRGAKDISIEAVKDEEGNELKVNYVDRQNNIKKINIPLKTEILVGGYANDGTPYISKVYIGTATVRTKTGASCQGDFSQSQFGITTCGQDSVVEWIFKASNDEIGRLGEALGQCQELKHEKEKIMSIITELKLLQRNKVSWKDLDKKETSDKLSKILTVTSLLQDSTVIIKIINEHTGSTLPSPVGGFSNTGYITFGQGYEWYNSRGDYVF